ncbi:ABC transporter permease [Peribacillus muralis]|uniref:ABC transporter permease n=1 Tax=Peribacillus muralis TaxID=264697 RepID=UPI001F4D6FD2|nr:ABC transporter permease [Peribacillus muralis]MCK1992922.1 ABC transporter permease [Peribacillus muralis]MCK2013477.1 ABC transporter permease [Peribacillus muralis]
MNSQNLWKERYLGYINETQKYLRYIFNGHLVFVMVLVLGGLAYYYSDWVKTLDGDFPAEWIMAVVLSLLVTRSPINTFLKEPDTVFLLPLETKLKSYFNNSLLLSWVMQGFILLVVLIAFIPMYMKVTDAGGRDFGMILAVLLILKFVNLIMRWNVLKYQDPSVSHWDSLIRFILNGVMLYFICSGANILFAIITLLILIGLCLYYRSAATDFVLKWERLVELENKRMNAFYQIANMFTDVPHLKGKVARRKWMDWLLSFIPYGEKSTYTFLYARTLLRSNDYVGLCLRLTIIGSVILSAFTNMWAHLIVTFLFLFMTALQLLPVWKIHEWKVWVSLYPLTAKMRESAVIKLISYFLFFEDFVFCTVLLVKGEWMSALATLALGLVFLTGFKVYATKKIKNF